LEEDVIKVGKI